MPTQTEKGLPLRIWERRFAHDEELIWQGRPQPGEVMDARDRGRAVIGYVIAAMICVVGAFVAYLLHIVVPLHQSLTVVLVIVAATVAYTYVQFRLRSTVVTFGQYYAVSNKRVYIAFKIFDHVKVVEYPLPPYGIHHDGQEPGTISFAGQDPIARIGKAMGRDIRFLRVRNAAKICDMMQKIAHQKPVRPISCS